MVIAFLRSKRKLNNVEFKGSCPSGSGRLHRGAMWGRDEVISVGLFNLFEFGVLVHEERMEVVSAFLFWSWRWVRSLASFAVTAALSWAAFTGEEESTLFHSIWVSAFLPGSLQRPLLAEFVYRPCSCRIGGHLLCIVFSLTQFYWWGFSYTILPGNSEQYSLE